MLHLGLFVGTRFNRLLKSTPIYLLRVLVLHRWDLPQVALVLRTTLNLLVLHGVCLLLGWARSLVPEISDHHGCLFAFRSNYTTTKPNTINQTPREATNSPPLICTTHVRKLRHRPCTNKNCWFAAYDRIAIFCSASHASDRAFYGNATVSSGPPGSEISYWHSLPQCKW